MNISSLINSNYVFATENATVLDVARIMENEGVGSVIIVDKNNNTIPIGIITDRDILLKASIKNQTLETLPVTKIMSTDLLKANQSDELEEIVGAMCERRVRRVPVVDENETLVGIVALDDIVKTASLLLNKIGLLIGRQR